MFAGLLLACPGSGEGETSTGPATSGPGSTAADGANSGPIDETTGTAPTTAAATTGEDPAGSTSDESTGAAQSSSSESAGEESGDTDTPGCPVLAPRGVWVWHQEEAQDPGSAAQLLEFAAAHAVTHLYLESESLLANDPERLAAFLGEAADACVAVELLFGAADWALGENHDQPLAIVDDALVFVEGLTARPAGLHFDVEPHGLPDWDANKQAYASQYLDLLDAMAADLAGSALPLTVDVAFWYDTVMIDRDGESRPLSELVQDRVDRVVLMDYRDHAEPPDGLIDNAEAELAYAAQIGRLVRVGVETTCGLEPEKVTFCEEGAAAMATALAATTAMFAANPAWDGVAIHDHEAWTTLPD